MSQLMQNDFKAYGVTSVLVFLLEDTEGEPVLAHFAHNPNSQTSALVAAAGVRRLLVTATRRDGSLAGPDLDLLADVLPARIPVLAAGGISSADDVVRLRELGCEGAVVGSALLAGRFTIADARAALAAG